MSGPDRARLREEIEQAFAETPSPPACGVMAPGGHVRDHVASLKTMEAEAFLSSLRAFMIASLDEPMEGDPIPAIIISEIPKRAAAVRALSPARKRALAKYVAAMAGDHELTKGHLLKALAELKA